ncbi:transcription factor RelB isoform X2 [Salarias fasciatus]|nr:transcription factor RelB-like isoform X2 [Salarias fasciatus]
MRRAACAARQMASAQSSRGASSSSSSSCAGPSLRGRGSPCLMSSKLPGCVPSDSLSDSDVLDRVLEKPRLVVVEEPKDRGMRFRYECEGRSAGSILGATSTDSSKTQPAIEIQGSIEHIKKVTVTVSLVTKDLPHRPHPHCLVGKDCPAESGICVVSFNPNSSRRHSFANLGIQCVKRKDLDLSLQKRRSQNIDPFQTGHTKGIEDIDMNAVRLCFQCELEWDDGRSDSLSPVVSKPIYDKKATTTSQLKISLLNQYSGSCHGRTEVFMLCDKVQKDDIEILFRHGSWKANGEFSQTDVHRQIAIVFKTPPYQDQDISEGVEVSVVLRRISDQMESEPVKFTYLPQNIDPYEVKRKRATIKSDISFKDKPCVVEERLQPPLPAAPAVEEMNYCEAQDANGDDELALLRLMELPEFWDSSPNPVNPSSVLAPFGFNQPPDAGSAFPAPNMNLNQNFNSFAPDFSHYLDVDFNMLQNAIQYLQDTEGQQLEDSMLQVKMEEEQ